MDGAEDALLVSKDQLLPESFILECNLVDVVYEQGYGVVSE